MAQSPPPQVLLLLLLLLVALARVSPVWAATLHVSPTGSDTNSGLSPAAALQTVSHALSQLSSAGDIVQLGAGSYPTPQAVSVAVAGVTIRGPNFAVLGHASSSRGAEAVLTKFTFSIQADNVVIEGLKFSQARSGSVAIGSSVSRSGLVVRNNVFEGMSTTHVNSKLVRAEGTEALVHSTITVEGNYFIHDSPLRFSVFMRFVNGLTVRNNRLDGNDMEARGFTLYDCDEVLFENNVVLNSKTTTLHVGCAIAERNLSSIVIRNNAFMQNGFTPVQVQNSQYLNENGCIIDSVVIEGNQISSWENNGALEVYSYGTSARFENMVIRNNRYASSQALWKPAPGTDPTSAIINGCVLVLLNGGSATSGSSTINMFNETCTITGGAATGGLAQQPVTFRGAGVTGYGNVKSLNITQLVVDGTGTNNRILKLRGVSWGDTFALPPAVNPPLNRLIMYNRGLTFDLADPASWGKPGVYVSAAGPFVEYGGASAGPHAWVPHEDLATQTYFGNNYTLYTARTDMYIYFGAVIEDGPPVSPCPNWWRRDSLEYRFYKEARGTYQHNGPARDGFFIMSVQRSGPHQLYGEMSPNIVADPTAYDISVSEWSGGWIASVRVKLSAFGVDGNNLAINTVCKDQDVPDSNNDMNRVWMSGDTEIPFPGVMENFKYYALAVPDPHVDLATTPASNKISVEGSRFRGLDEGVKMGGRVASGASVTIQESIFEGIQSAVDSTVAAVDARRNFWGHPKGPRDP